MRFNVVERLLKSWMSKIQLALIGNEFACSSNRSKNTIHHYLQAFHKYVYIIFQH